MTFYNDEIDKTNFYFHLVLSNVHYSYVYILGCSLSEPISLNEDDLKCGENFLSNVCQTKVCNDRAEVIDCGDAASEWLESMLKVSGIRLVKLIKNRSKQRKSKESEGE